MLTVNSVMISARLTCMAKGFDRKVFVPPANEVCEDYVFTGVCLSTGGHVWRGGTCVAGGVCGGGMHGRGACVAGGACMVGGMRGRGACMAGGVHGGGACVVGGHVWWEACVAGGGACIEGGCVWWGCSCQVGGTPLPPPHRYYGYGILSMSGRYASYWNAFFYSKVSI